MGKECKYYAHFIITSRYWYFEKQYKEYLVCVEINSMFPTAVQFFFTSVCVVFELSREKL